VRRGSEQQLSDIDERFERHDMMLNCHTPRADGAAQPPTRGQLRRRAGSATGPPRPAYRRGHRSRSWRALVPCDAADTADRGPARRRRTRGGVSEGRPRGRADV
jgi:hypothetical protein